MSEQVILSYSALVADSPVGFDFACLTTYPGSLLGSRCLLVNPWYPISTECPKSPLPWV